MKNTQKYMVAGILIGATVATTAIVLFSKKAIIKTEVHLFNMDNQVGKEDIVNELVHQCHVPSCDDNTADEPTAE